MLSDSTRFYNIQQSFILVKKKSPRKLVKFNK